MRGPPSKLKERVLIYITYAPLSVITLEAPTQQFSILLSKNK